MQFGAWGLGLGILGSGCGVWRVAFRVDWSSRAPSSQGPSTLNLVSPTPNTGTRTWRTEPGVETRNPTSENRNLTRETPNPTPEITHPESETPNLHTLNRAPQPKTEGLTSFPSRIQGPTPGAWMQKTKSETQSRTEQTRDTTPKIATPQSETNNSEKRNSKPDTDNDKRGSNDAAPHAGRQGQFERSNAVARAVLPNPKPETRDLKPTPHTLHPKLFPTKESRREGGREGVRKRRRERDRDIEGEGEAERCKSRGKRSHRPRRLTLNTQLPSEEGTTQQASFTVT